MDFLFKSKKAGERYISPWLFINWGVIALFFVLVILLFISSLGDVRKVEAYTMNFRIADCLSENFNLMKISDSGFDIYSECGLSKAAFDSGNFYVNIRVYEMLSYSPIFKTSLKAGRDFEVECDSQFFKQVEIEQKNRGKAFLKNFVPEKNLPICSFREISVVDASLKEYKIKITTASNQK